MGVRMRLGRIATGMAALLLAVSPIRAQTPAIPPATGDAPLEEILVTGEFSGPGMWKVSRAGDAAGHVLWIVGDPQPLPKRLEWKSSDIEAVALGAQEILRDASVSMQPDEKIGFFR